MNNLRITWNVLKSRKQKKSSRILKNAKRKSSSDFMKSDLVFGFWFILHAAAFTIGGQTRMEELGISPEDKVICFGQLLGMCDQISFPLGE